LKNTGYGYSATTRITRGGAPSLSAAPPQHFPSVAKFFITPLNFPLDKLKLNWKREAIRRRLCNATTDIFDDDAAGLTKLDEEDISDLLASLPDDLPDDEDPL